VKPDQEDSVLDIRSESVQVEIIQILGSFVSLSLSKLIWYV